MASFAAFYGRASFASPHTRARLRARSTCNPAAQARAELRLRWLGHHATRFRTDPCFRALMGIAARIFAARRVTDEAIVEALTSPDCTNRQVGARVGLHEETIRRIRTGELYPDVRPDLPRLPANRRRRNTMSCWNCVHRRVFYEERKDGKYSTRASVCCGIGLPDPGLHGPRFAKDCAIYLHENDVAA